MAYVHLARANYENVQNAKFVQKFAHTFARTVAKLRSNFRFAEPLFSNMTATETAREKVHVLHILTGTTNRLQIAILALAARNFIWGSAISAVLTNQTAQT